MAKRPFTFDNSLTNSFLQPLPNLFSRNRSESKLVRSASNQQLNKTTIVSKVRSRNQKTKVSVDPELAAAVVKGYLLPMFEAKSKTLAAQTRTFKFGSDEKIEGYESRIGTTDTVYSDLKLTEKLMEEIENLRHELELARRESKEAKQLLNSNQEENQQLIEKYESLELNFELMKFQMNQQYKALQRSESKSGLIVEQLDRYKKLFKESSFREEELNICLHDERAENDIRYALFFIYP